MVSERKVEASKGLESEMDLVSNKCIEKRRQILKVEGI